MIVNHSGIVNHKGIVKHGGIVAHDGITPIVDDDGVLFQDGTGALFQNGNRADFQGFQAGDAPVANAGANQTLPDGSTITLDGTATTGTAPITYAWTQVSGPSVTITDDDQATATITGAPVGSYVFKLTASNSYGSSESTTDVEMQAAGCITAWSTDAPYYPPAAGTITGAVWSYAANTGSGVVNLVPDHQPFEPQTDTTVFECAIAVDAPIIVTGGNFEIIGQISVFDQALSSQITAAVGTSISLASPALSVSIGGATAQEIELVGTDLSKFTALSIEFLGDDTFVGKCVYDGTTHTTSPQSAATIVGNGVPIFTTLLTAAGTAATNNLVTLKDSSDWVMAYPANAQDLCGNTQ